MKERPQTARNGKIEVMRFICATSVLLMHFRVDGETGTVFPGGAIAVEFFFILSGYLMMASIDRADALPGGCTDLGEESFRFIVKKFKALYPEVLIAYCIGFAVRMAAERPSFGGFLKVLVGSIWETALLRSVGLQFESINTIVWYLSAMLICMAIYYPLVRKYRKMATHIVVPLASLLVLGYLCENYSSPRVPIQWIGFTYKGVLRAFGELGMGIVCYQATKAFRQLHLTRLGKMAVTCLEPVLYALYIAYMAFVDVGKTDWIVIPILMLAIGISFSGQTLTEGLLDNRIAYTLGRFSLALYLGHYYWSEYLAQLLPQGPDWRPHFCVYVCLGFGTSIVIYLLAAWIRRQKAAEKLLRLFVQPSGS